MQITQLSSGRMGIQIEIAWFKSLYLNHYNILLLPQEEPKDRLLLEYFFFDFALFAIHIYIVSHVIKFCLGKNVGTYVGQIIFKIML